MAEATEAHILVVCRANVARSPLAAAMLGIALAGTGVAVSSAGVQATEGARPARGSVELAAQRGLDLTGHRSRPVTTDLLATADLVVTMSEAHRAVCTQMGPGLGARTFTLRELDRLTRDTAAAAPPPQPAFPNEAPHEPATRHGARHEPVAPNEAPSHLATSSDGDLFASTRTAAAPAPATPAGRLQHLIRAAHQARPAAQPPTASEDIADPMGRDWEHWFALADELDVLLGRLATRLVP